jgi:hypothetical protein
MAWAADKSALERLFNQDIPASQPSTGGPVILEADATRAIARATAHVEGVLTQNGYTPATVSGATTTGAYYFCDNLILSDAALQLKLWWIINNPQADAENIAVLKKRVDEDYELLTNNPETVLVGVTLPAGANTASVSSLSKISYDDGGDDEPGRAFGRDSMVY